MVVFILSLSQMARNTISKVFWTRPSIKELMKTTFIYYNIPGSFEDDEKCFALKHKFFTEAYHQLENLHLSLPFAIKRQLRISIRVWGESVFVWLKDISRMMSALGDNSINNMENFIENICFTDCGTVYPSATFRKIYCAKPLAVDTCMWILACELCLEEFILQWHPRSKKSNDIGKMVKFIFQESTLKRNSDFESLYLSWDAHRVDRYSYYTHFFMYWELWRTKDRTIANWRLFIEYIREFRGSSSFDVWEIYDTRNSIEENMFRVSVVIGNFQAVKYFWNKLSTEAKSRGMQRIIAIACYYCFKMRHSAIYLSCNRDVLSPGRTQYFDVICFLIQRIPQSQSDNLFTFMIESSRVGRDMLKEILPVIFLVNHAKYPEFCLDATREILEYVSNQPFTHLHSIIMMNLLKILHQDAELHGEDVFDAFYEYWRLSPIDVKSERRSYLRNMWLHDSKWKFVSVLDEIINDPDSPKFDEGNDLLRRSSLELNSERHR